ncbi:MULTISPECIES: cohesin domain-containing protein [unclassified Ruminococcus]|uniref:cohesin domain-containing protein n=1 Tax=unclassified Ruminococcus TaxID=2608920 RepID=UPI00210BF15C|nr:MULTISPECIES: cohesin domain-containing protein [unclassified Ruminococcus]MCQ4023168.1 hypothetical protein [Ruminococcus sp. zg-924]MCQ4115386.1 hypothetical protein [Ruminococcus sp. zg-921]
MKIKSVSKSFLSVMLSCATLMCALSLCQSASAAEGKKCTVNDVELSVGDVFTYTLDISDVKEKLSGIDISIYYNPEDLSLNSDKISLPVFKNAVMNPKIQGEIRLNAIDAANGFDFSNGGTVISAEFKVLDSAKDATNVTFSVRELYNMDVEEVTDYKTKVSIKKGSQPDSEVVKPKSLDEIEQAASTQYEQSGGEFPFVWVIVCAAVLAVAAGVIVFIFVKRRKKNIDDKNVTFN